MTVTVDIADIKAKLIEKLKPSGWADKLKSFVYSGEFDSIIKQLIFQREQGLRFTPVMKDAFSAFEECPYKDLKVVIVGQDPYPQLGVADGMAFSCSKTTDLQPSLKYMLESIQKTVYPNEKYEYNQDLRRWANQGVLLLNSALTTQVGVIGKHYDIWKPFVGYVIDILNSTNSGLIWVFMGKVAQEWNELIGDNHYIVNISHPASAYHNKTKEWDCENLFNQVNDTLLRNNNTKIIW